MWVRHIVKGNHCKRFSQVAHHIIFKETTYQKSRSLTNLSKINEIDVDNEPQEQIVNIELGIPKIFRRKSFDLTKINIESDVEKEEYTQYKQLNMPVIKISQYNSTNGLNKWMVAYLRFLQEAVSMKCTWSDDSYFFLSFIYPCRSFWSW